MSQGPPAGSVLQRNVASPGNQPQSPKDDDRKVRRREKNRVAAQRSRKKQTQKADKLHEAGPVLVRTSPLACVSPGLYAGCTFEIECGLSTLDFLFSRGS
ncbi:basic leucine zipper transcriptional factor ATF-like 3 isoform X3 [Mastomys coucha]|uniref:basic leucine zipper transcriptional factor ATF-like 3 isoform X3 n=1 Tax=Mastomys coucha TaxID=35658 RepID=UPI0012626FC1|nr:basic leucine zipper transcriptional factor ATF-like 3 isoform X3 [Mastomys coucha]